MIVTARARILLFLAVVCASIGLVEYIAFLVQFGVAMVLWIGVEWCVFRFRADSLVGRVQVERQVVDRTGEARVLWKGRPTRVRLQVRVRPVLRWLPATMALWEDLLPMGASCPDDGDDQRRFTSAIRGSHTHEVEYPLRTETMGSVRFPGLRCVLEDQHGFFLAERFVPLPQKLRVLPVSHKLDMAKTLRKPRNVMPPPGIHRIAKAGAGSELLDIRDYVAGDPPKSVAWKVSARRDALMTKQFETDVPVCCQMFVDMARSTRLGYPGPCLAGRLVEVAMSVSQLLISQRDAVGLSVFDGNQIKISRPSANRRSQLQMMDLLANCIDQPVRPVATSVDKILPAALDVAHTRYPDAMYHLLEAFRGRFVPRREKHRLRECLAALLSARYSLDAWSVGELAVNDQELCFWSQRFLAEHQIPYPGDRFDANGRYLFDDRAKIPQLSRMLTHASARSRDSELFVVLAELCDVEYDVAPLLNAIKLASARQHRVAVLCAWPAGMPSSTDPKGLESLIAQPLSELDRQLEMRQRVNAFNRIRNELGRLHVPVAVAAEDQAIPLIAAQLDIVRSRRTVA